MFVQPIYQWLNENLGWIPLFAGPVSGTGRTILTVSFVLAIMILPIMSALAREIFLQTPKLNEEAALALGATRWEMIQLAVLPFARSGLLSSAMLGLGRAVGETMAVAFIIGNSFQISGSIFSPGTTISAAIASEFAEASGVHMSALILLGLLLFILTFIVLAAARLMLARLQEKQGK